MLILCDEEGNDNSISPAVQKVLEYLFEDARLLYQVDDSDIQVEVPEGLFLSLLFKLSGHFFHCSYIPFQPRVLKRAESF